MLVSSFDIIQLEIVGLLLTQVVRNVFHYEVIHEGGGAVDISDVITAWFVDFDTNVLPPLSEKLTYNTVIGKNLTNPIQIYEAGVTANGDLAGDILPAHDCLSVKLVRTTGITRNGRKAYSGVAEAIVTDGVHSISPAQVTALEEFHYLDKPFVTLGDPAINVTFRPIIVGRTETAPGIYTLDLAKINTIKGAQLRPIVKTQNTRKN